MDEKEFMIKVGDDGISGQRKKFLKMKQIDYCCDFVHDITIVILFDI